MKEYEVTLVEAEIRKYTWRVKAEDRFMAEKFALDGKGELIGSKFVDGCDAVERRAMEIWQKMPDGRMVRIWVNK